MPTNDTYANAQTPIVDGQPYVFARVWFRFFDNVSKKANILAGVFSNSATAGTASNLPSKPAGYMSIIDDRGVTRKVPYYNE